MVIKVLTCESEQESAARLGFPTQTFIGDYAYKFDNQIIIRWGNSRLVYTKDGRRTAEFKNVINPAYSIKTNCRKAGASKLLAQVVNVPTLYEKSVPKGVLAVIRPVEHSAGNEFSVKKGPFKIEPDTYGARFLKTDTEYRVWFCGDKTMCGRRVKMKVNPDEEYPCRSNWGYQFCDNIASELHHQTLMAAKKIGLEVGAADVLFYKRKYYFLELNSAPSVDHRVVREFFQRALQELIDKKFPPDTPKKEEAPAVIHVEQKKTPEPEIKNEVEPVTVVEVLNVVAEPKVIAIPPVELEVPLTEPFINITNMVEPIIIPDLMLGMKTTPINNE